MNELKKDLGYFFLFMILLFIGWVVTGGPQKSKENGDAYNKFQEPLAPISSGETYDHPILP